MTVVKISIGFLSSCYISFLFLSSEIFYCDIDGKHNFCIDGKAVSSDAEATQPNHTTFSSCSFNCLSFFLKKHSISERPV